MSATTTNSCDHLQFRAACSKFPTGVTVITTRSPDGLPRGITVSSFTSASLDPPLVLICIDYRSPIVNFLVVGQFFGINVLSEQQQTLSLKFAKSWNDRFVNVTWHCGKAGVPLLLDVSASFECEVVNIVPGGDHAIVIAKVHHINIGDIAPLVFFNSSFTTLINDEGQVSND